MNRPDRSWLYSCLVLIVVPLVFYAAMVFKGWEPQSADTQSVKPFGVWGTELEKKLGEVPSWYPYIFSGMPSYGSFIYTPRSPLNPMTLLTAPFSKNRGARYVLYFALAGIGTALFVRRNGASWVAATGAGLFFAMTPYIPGSVSAGHATKLEALCLIPMFLLALDLLVSRPEPLRAGFLALTGAALAWAHHPQIAYYGLMIGGIYVLGRVVFERRKEMGPADWGRLLGFALLAVILAGALVTEPYLGVREYAPFSIRGGGGDGAGPSGAGWDYATNWSFHPAELISFLFPGWFGLRDRTYWGLMPFTQSTHYFGIVGLALAIVGAGAIAKARRILWIVLAAMVLLIGFGRCVPILFGPMYAAAPLFNKFRVPSMIYAVLPLCLATFAAAGIDRIARGTPVASARKPKGARSESTSSHVWWDLVPKALGASVLLTLLWLVLGFALGGSLGQSALLLRAGEASKIPASAISEVTSERFEILRSSVLIGLIWITLLLGGLELGRRRVLSGARLAALLAVLLVGDLLWIDRKFYEPAPPATAAETFPAKAAAQYLASKPGPFRVIPLGSLFTSNGFGLYGVESVGGYQPAKLREYQDLLDSNLISNPGVLQMLGVRYAVSPQPLPQSAKPEFNGDASVYDLGVEPTWVWSVDRVERVSGRWEQMSRRFLDQTFDPKRIAYVYDQDPGPGTEQLSPAQVSNLIRGSEELSFEVESSGPALLVMSEIYYAPGWEATVDGAATPLYRADHVLRSIEVPAGHHRVVVRSVARGERAGERISRFAGLGLLATLIAGVVPLWRKARLGR